MNRSADEPTRFLPNQSYWSAPVFESLEGRLLLNSAPVFDILPADRYAVDPARAVTIGIDGFDTDGDALAISAVSDDADLSVTLVTGNQYARLRFVEADGQDIGEVVLQLFESRAPLATERFINLSGNYVNPDGTLDATGTAFYTDVVVHRVIPNFMVQAGDAVNGDGTGGSPLGEFEDQFDPVLSFAGPGVLAMANSGPDTNDSQFFITTAPAGHLDQVHTIFGQVISGQDVVNRITHRRRSSSDLPVEQVLLQAVEIFLSDQDATATFQATEGFDGQATVTITLDDGQGNQTIRQVTVLADPGLGGRPTIETDQDYFTDEYFRVDPGQSGQFTVTVTDADSPAADLNVWIDADMAFPGVEVGIEPDPEDAGTYTVAVALPTGYDGGSFDVKISASEADLGDFGNLPAAEAVFTVTVLGDRPVIEDPGEVRLAGGESTTLEVIIEDDFDADLAVGIENDLPAADITIVPTATDGVYEVAIELPPGYEGAFGVTISAVETEPAGLTPSTRTFIVSTLGDRPTIGDVEDVTMLPEQIVEVPVEIVDDGDLAMAVTIDSDHHGVTVDVAQVGATSTYTITISAPADVVSIFDVTVSAVEAGYDGLLAPATRTFSVSTLGDRPTIANPTEDLRLTPAELFTFDAGITDDGGLDMDVSVQSDINGTAEEDQVVTLTSHTDPDTGVTTHTVTIDLTKKLPDDFTGFFDVTLSAVESLADNDAAPTTHSFSVFVQHPYDPLMVEVVHPSDSATVAVVAGERLYVGTTGGLEVFDLSAGPLDPTWLGAYNTDNQISEIVVVGDTAYVAVYGQYYQQWDLITSDGDLLSLDVSDPADITLLDTVETDSLVPDLAIDADLSRLYLANWADGVSVYDIADPENMELLGSFKDGPAGFSLESASAVDLRDNFAFVADAQGLFAVLSVSDPGNIAHVRHISTHKYGLDGDTRDVVVQDDRLYVCDYQTGIFVYDVTNAARPRRRGWFPWRASHLAVQDHVVVLSFNAYHVFFDASDTARMSRSYMLQSAGSAGRPTFSGGYAVLAAGSEGAALMDAGILSDSQIVAGRRTFATADGPVTVGITGGGLARVFTDPIEGNIERVDVVGSTRRTAVTITAGRGAAATIGEVNIYGSLRSFSARRVILTGDLTVDGGVSRLTLGDVGTTGDRREQLIRIAGPDDVGSSNAVNIVLGRVSDLRIDSGMPVRSITAVEWLDDETTWRDGQWLGGNYDEADTIIAPSLRALKIKGRRLAGLAGDFQAGLDLSEERVLGSAVIAGRVSDSDWNLAGGARAITVGRWETGSITADWIGSLTTRAGAADIDGRFAASLTVAGAVGNVSIAGSLTGTWSADSVRRIVVAESVRDMIMTLLRSADVAGKLLALGSLNVKGRIKDSRFLIAGNVGTVATCGMDSTDLYAGYVAGAPDAVTGLSTGAAVCRERRQNLPGRLQSSYCGPWCRCRIDRPLPGPYPIAGKRPLCRLPGSAVIFRSVCRPNLQRRHPVLRPRRRG